MATFENTVSRGRNIFVFKKTKFKVIKELLIIFLDCKIKIATSKITPNTFLNPSSLHLNCNKKLIQIYWNLLQNICFYQQMLQLTFKEDAVLKDSLGEFGLGRAGKFSIARSRFKSWLLDIPSELPAPLDSEDLACVASWFERLSRSLWKRGLSSIFPRGSFLWFVWFRLERKID